MIARLRPSIAVALLLGAPLAADEPRVEVKVTQKYLEPVCLDDTAVKPGQRRWKLGRGPHTLAFTMRNAPRTGVQPKQAPGVATVSFTLEASHKYEVEVRAAAMAFSTRTWERGEWKPAVRDRTTDRVISGEPSWSDSGCRP